MLNAADMGMARWRERGARLGRGRQGKIDLEESAQFQGTTKQSIDSCIFRKGHDGGVELHKSIRHCRTGTVCQNPGYNVGAWRDAILIKEECRVSGDKVESLKQAPNICQALRA